MKSLVGLIVLSITLISCSYSDSAELPIEVVPAFKETTVHKEIEKPLITSATLIAIGDILVHQSVYTDAVTDQGVYHFFPMFEKVMPFIENADIAIANQETMIGGKELGLSSYPTFNSPYEIGDALKETGIDIVTLANNHTLDRGEKAILNALNHWDAIDMLYTGAFKSSEDREIIRTVTKNGITFSFLSYSYGTNGIPIPKDKSYLINLIDLKLIEQDIEKANTLSDVIVVSMHWGNEYETSPNEAQIDLANALSTLGADIIIGHHPHVLQPFDWIERTDGSKTLVMYSLGNFLSAQEGVERLSGGIGGVEVTKIVEQGKTVIKLADPSFVPTYTYYKDWRDFEVIPMYQLNESYLPNYEAHYEKTQSHMNAYMKEITFMEDFNSGVEVKNEKTFKQLAN